MDESQRHANIDLLIADLAAQMAHIATLEKRELPISDTYLAGIEENLRVALITLEELYA